MTGFTTTATISELIDKRPINRKRKRNKTRNKRVLKAKQKLLRLS
jgi:hypothetical protein|tara:strand:+ start:886 stop:1020 length:135 start_codon:yes stop_codon:yes gene_type:complete